MKHQAKRLLSCVRLANSLRSTHMLRNRSFHTQVTRFPHHSSSFPSTQLFNSVSPFHKFHRQELFFSTTSEQNIDKLLSKNWDKELEEELSNLYPRLNHETVVYILKKFGKDNPEKASSFFKWATEEKGFRPSTRIYSFMLTIYARNHAMKEFWIVMKDMKEKGCCIDKETYARFYSDFRNSKMINDATALKQLYEKMLQENAVEAVVQKVVEMIKNSDWSRELERELEEMRFKVTENFVLRVLKELRPNGGLPLKALIFFKWVGESLGYEHTTVTYNGILRILCKEEAVVEFWNVVKEMKDVGHEIDIHTFVKVMREFQKSKMVKDAVKLYEHMLDSPFKPLEKECSILLRTIAAAQDPDLDLMFRVVKKYEDSGNCLLKNDYDGIHRCLTSIGKFDEAEKIIETRRNAGYEPDNVTYSQLEFGLCKARRLEEACEVLHMMEAQGCIPDIKTWTIIIKGFCVVNDVDKALLWFGKMMHKGVDADSTLLDVLVYGFLKERRAIEAYQLVVKMIDRAHVIPFQANFKDLIDKLLGERRLEEALNLLHLMKNHNYPPYAEAIIQYISKFGSVGDALGCLAAISKSQYPSVSTYQRVLQSFFNEGRHSEAKDLLFKCPHHIRKHESISSLFGSSESGKLVADSA